MKEAPAYKKIDDILKLPIAKNRCINCNTFPMRVMNKGGGLVCPNCKKQFWESPEENFVRIIYENYVE
ncbi:unnamed protein product [marine sediment metagenome]|uniref:Uncharacterized protein n=1 Tax=marine sediment metagenome TaxID=412755 RepID=X1E851_9ZZZZ